MINDNGTILEINSKIDGPSSSVQLLPLLGA